jgi:pyridoxamine 5'-phosphate oxidase
MPHPTDPISLFKRWFRDAVRAGAPLPEAMALATATRKGMSSVRMVLHRGFSRGGFVFYTNYNSRKSSELAENPRAAFVFHWPELERQVRAEGRVERIARAESVRYFRTRPRDSQIGAWASPQSSEIPDRAFLDREVSRIVAKFPGPVPCPPFWGGYRIIPHRIEFWQGQPFRLHDRVCYTKSRGKWRVARLAP